MARILQHKRGEGGKFSSKYRVYRFVYYECFERVFDLGCGVVRKLVVLYTPR
jgi:hypothetical protein